MTTLDVPYTISSERVRVSSSTTAADEDTLASPEVNLERPRDQWQRIVDHQLVEWGKDPGQLEDDQIIPPSAVAIQTAIDLAYFFRDKSMTAPTRVVPDGDGGVVFEREAGNVFETIEIEEDGTVELLHCIDGAVRYREVILRPA